ncbi:MAG: transglycosylase SLT domain-containing protein [Gammaproteobacteria bacterium]
MATRPIITIDVADSAFQRFLSLFNEYTTKLGEQPEAWAKINDAMGGAGKSLESGAISGKEALALAAAQAGVVAEALSEATKAQNEFGRSVNRSGKGMESLAKSAKGVGSAISAVAGGILKIAAGLGLGALLGGLGIGDLTDAAFSRIRSAGQLGVRTGQLSSFQVNAQQFLTTSALSAAANAKNDPGSISQFGALGISNGERLNLSTPALAFLMAQKAAAAYRTNPGMAAYLPAIRAYQNLGGSLGDVRNVAMHPRAFALAQENYRADIASLNISREEGQAWVQLKLKMDLAGQTIQTALINKLGPLVPEITKLTVAVIGAVTSFIGGKNFDTVVQDAKLGIGQLAKFVLKTNWEQLGKNISRVSDDIGAVAKVLGYLNPKKNIQRIHRELTTGHDTVPVVGPLLKNLGLWMTDPLPTNLQIAARRKLGDYAAARIYNLNELASKKYGVPAGILNRLSMDESGYGRSLISSAGALGVDQFMPGTAKGYGINPLDTRQSTDAAGKMLIGLFAKYKSWNKAIAAYNWGGGNLDADIKRHGADWLEYAPKQTQGEVRNVVGQNASRLNAEIIKILKATAKSRPKSSAPVHVTITNHTAARVDVSANAAAFG